MMEGKERTEISEEKYRSLIESTDDSIYMIDRDCRYQFVNGRVLKRLKVMEKKIIGKAYVLGDNIDTDQIIPAEHLVYSTSDPEELKKYGHFALSSVPVDGAGLPDGGKQFIIGNNYKSE